MRKYIIIILMVVIIPLNVKALKLNTKITGDDTAFNGSKIVYTVIVDQKLTNYKAEIIYDREVLNLVDIKEINIDTNTKNFEIDKTESIIVKSDADINSSIIYTIEFKVKELTKIDKTKIGIKTLLAKNSEQEFNLDELDMDIFISDSSSSNDNEISNTRISNTYLKGILNSIKNISKEYGDPVLYGSIILNIILLIALISNIVRKRVDYDF